MRKKGHSGLVLVSYCCPQMHGSCFDSHPTPPLETQDLSHRAISTIVRGKRGCMGGETSRTLVLLIQHTSHWWSLASRTRLENGGYSSVVLA